MRAARRRENIGLWRSKRDWQTCWYSEEVKYDWMWSSLAGSCSEAGARARLVTKRFKNHCNENWYMGSINDRSATQKYSKEARSATGTYDSLAESMSFSTSLDSAICCLISAAVFLEFCCGLIIMCVCVCVFV